MNALPKQTQRYTISIYDENTILTDHTKEGDPQFNISQEQFMNFFSYSVKFRPEKGLIWQNTSPDGIECLIDLGRIGLTSVFVASYSKKENDRKVTEYKMDIPGLIAKARLHQDREGVYSLSQLHIACYAGSKVRPDSILYALPLPNIGSTSVCLADAHAKNQESIKEAILTTFFDSPFNNHHDYCGKEGLTFKKFHKKYKGKMPYTKLIKLGKASSVFNF